MILFSWVKPSSPDCVTGLVCNRTISTVVYASLLKQACGKDQQKVAVAVAGAGAGGGWWTGVAWFWHHPNGKGPFAVGQLQKDVSWGRRSFVTTHSWARLPFSELCSSGAAVKLWPWASCQQGASHWPPTAANPQLAVECAILLRQSLCPLTVCGWSDRQKQ